MPAVSLYLKIHQPLRIKPYSFFDIGVNHRYFNGEEENSLNNRRVLERVVRKSYLPTARIILELLKRHPKFKIAFSFSGVWLEQIAKFHPEVLRAFKEIFKSGRAEVLGETYYHSLSFLYSRQEFVNQIKLQEKILKKIFNLKPRVFANTELVFNNKIAGLVAREGYKAILAEGWDKTLGWRSPNFVYRAKTAKKIILLLKNYRLSDDIAFRFSERTWKEYPLTAEKFAAWISAITEPVVNLFLDFETFGEHQWEETGIFDFLRKMPEEILKSPNNYFLTPSEEAKNFKPADALDIPDYLSWADLERDLSAWNGNKMQEESLRALYKTGKSVLKTKNKPLIDDWRKLTTSDHSYYMCTKYFADGDVHKYFSPYESPYEAFIAFNNVLSDIKLRCKEKK
ncbi:MAG: glycoside hydrolase family 57 protein [bacterium]|nr:glycoside hydrolase family 57 protein [bacterium]